jgi:CRISPR-associated protein Cas1
MAFGRESLACDLVEPLRARVDAFVWELFRTRVLRAEHFRQEQGACRLDKAGRAHFYEYFESVLRAAGKQLRRYCRLLVRALMADGQERAVVDVVEETM